MPVSVVASFMEACFGDQIPSRLAVALSGGPDSMALLVALLQWRQHQGRHVDIVPLIVDHGLRPESASQAAYVADVAKQWGCQPHVLLWVHPPGIRMTSGVMEVARQARYRLMARACVAAGIEHLFVGHHADDVLETFCMRHTDHTPWYGQAGMSCAVYRLGVWIWRPWLGIGKADLLHWLTSVIGPEPRWIEDSSNQRLCFARARVRQELAHWCPSQRALSAQRMRHYGELKQERMVTLAQRVRLTRHDAALVVHDIPLVIDGLTSEEGCWLLQAWLGALTFRPWPRLASQKLFWQRLAQMFTPFPTPYRVIGPLGGCLWVQQRHQLWIFRDPHSLLLTPTWGADMLWDDRVFVPEGCQASCHESPLAGPWPQRWQRLALPTACPFPVTPPWRTVWCGWPWPLFALRPPVWSDITHAQRSCGLSADPKLPHDTATNGMPLNGLS